MNIRGYNLAGASKDLQNIIDERTKEFIKKYDKKGKDAMRSIYEDGVKSWATPNTANEIINSTRYSSKLSQVKGTSTLTIKARLDMIEYKKKTKDKNIYIWFERHKRPTKEKYVRTYHTHYPARPALTNNASVLPQFFLADQIFNKGIETLPYLYYKELIGTDYFNDFLSRHPKSSPPLYNKKFAQKEPLLEYLKRNLQKEWVNKINED